MNVAVKKLAAIAALLAGSAALHAQATRPAAAPATKPAAQAPAAPLALSNLDPFPPVNPKYFTADQPTPETVNAFLKQLWGYDTNRVWSVQRILKTSAPNVSRVIVYVTDRGASNQVQATSLYVMPDQKHAISGGEIINFGPTPFADNRKMLQQRADGPSRGGTGKDFMIVEFMDLQCPHCKEQQVVIEKLLHDFPNAHLVIENFPLTEIHPAAYKAAAYGICVASKSNDAFFKFEQAVFDRQDSLTADGMDQALAESVTYAGLDPAAISACSDDPATRAKLDAQIDLGKDLNIDQTPEIAVNGRVIPMSLVPYDVLKQIIKYQALQDGVSTGAAPAPPIAMPKPSIMK